MDSIKYLTHPKSKDLSFTVAGKYVWQSHAVTQITCWEELHSSLTCYLLVMAPSIVKSHGIWQIGSCTFLHLKPTCTMWLHCSAMPCTMLLLNVYSQIHPRICGCLAARVRFSTWGFGTAKSSIKGLLLKRHPKAIKVYIFISHTTADHSRSVLRAELQNVLQLETKSAMEGQKSLSSVQQSSGFCLVPTDFVVFISTLRAAEEGRKCRQISCSSCLSCSKSSVCIFLLFLWILKP